MLATVILTHDITTATDHDVLGEFHGALQMRNPTVVLWNRRREWAIIE